MKRIKKNLGWIKDYPDIRDYNKDTSITLRNPLKPESKESLKGLLKRVGISGESKKTLEKKVDNRKWCSPVKDQGNIGSCTAFAAVGIYEYFQKRAFNKYIDGSELFVYKTTRNMLDLDYDSGAYTRTAMGSLALFGVPPTNNYPYEIEKFNNEPPAFIYSYAQNFQALLYYRLDPLGTTGHQTLINVKKQLSAGIPSIMGFTCYNSLNYEETYKTGKIPYPEENESVIGGHAVMVVGYDDDLVISNPIDKKRRKGALIIRNSWGENWGDDGYGYIPYEYVKQQLASDFWCLISAEWMDTGKFTF
ncbi:C1 family peptidase [Flavivirga aquimarina]|uniref:C1 family peptidase n=1 Tax=Flavivirga aquimarina TaxID=2027862 RepID=A0ABT8WGI5_9FLAO|nr:C1 family peptidase [Flavivirga aquimarina]MDO5972187.1 C1 family peptidase [Flavivirga aquimarina]